MRYADHSFRAGAATTAAASGTEDPLIKTMGRWESSTYLLYIRIPQGPAPGHSSSAVMCIKTASDQYWRTEYLTGGVVMGKGGKEGGMYIVAANLCN